LPRNITPSDIDMTLDNNGHIMQFELDDETACWEFIKKGQRRLQESYVRAGRGRITAVLLRHRVPATIEDQIDTTKDILQFSIMRWANGQVLETGPFPGEKFVRYVRLWWDRCDNERVD
jgi:hypothetical protein